jgi:hypothetical protein
MDLDPALNLALDPDPTPNLTPFFSDFKDAKNKFSLHFFLLLTRRHTILSPKKLNCLLKFCVKILFGKHYFSLLNIFMRKKKDPVPEPDPDPHF